MHRFIYLGLVSALLSACGGDDGGGPAEPALPYTGLTTEAVLDDNGAAVNGFADDFVLLEDIVSDRVGTVSIASAALAPSRSGKKALQRAQAAATSEALPCQHGSGTVNAAAGKVTWTYEKCVIDGTTLNGTVVYLDLGTDAVSTSRSRTTFDLTMQDSKENATLTGTVSHVLGDLAPVASATATLLYKNNANGEESYFKDIRFESRRFSGRIYRSNRGYLTLSTPEAVDLPYSEYSSDRPAGTVVLTGANGRSIEIKAEGPNHELESLGGYGNDIAGLTWDWRWAIRFQTEDANQAPKQRWVYHFRGGEYQDRNDTSTPAAPTLRTRDEEYFTDLNTAVTLDASYSSDANGDLLSFAWTLVGKPEGSRLTLAPTHGAQLTVTPDETGRYTFKVTATGGMDTVEKIVTLDCYQRVVLKTGGDIVDFSGYAFDEKHQRVIKAVAPSSLQAIDIRTGEITTAPLSGLPSSVRHFAVSDNGAYFAAADASTVTLYDADTLGVIRSFNVGSVFAQASPGIGSIKVGSTGKVYLSYEQGPSADLYSVTVLELDLSQATPSYQKFDWDDEGDRFQGSVARLQAVDEDRGRLVVSAWSTQDGALVKQIRTADLATRSQIAFRYRYSTDGQQHEADSAYFLKNRGILVDEYGGQFDIETLALATDKLANVRTIRVLTSIGSQGVVWFGEGNDSMGTNRYLYRQESPGQATTRWRGPRDRLGLGEYALEPSVIWVSGDLKHQYWLASRPAIGQTPLSLEFVRY